MSNHFIQRTVDRRLVPKLTSLQTEVSVSRIGPIRLTIGCLFTGSTLGWGGLTSTTKVKCLGKGNTSTSATKVMSGQEGRSNRRGP